MNENTQAPQDVGTIVAISRRTDAQEVAVAAYDQLLELLDTLSPSDWDAQTDCPGWSVADMVGHLIGAARGCINVREFARLQLYGLRHRKEYGGNAMDAYNALHIAEHAELTPAQRVSTLRDLVPPSIAGRFRLARMLHLITAPVDQSGSTAAGMPHTENGGHLYEVVVTRDVWMHTVDISQAVGLTPNVSAPFNRRLIADVVAEWAGRHRQPFTLHLSGPAGGSYTQGASGVLIDMDAVEFARALSGRAPGTGLLATRVLF